MIEIRSLEGVSFETMTAAFNDAFSDYAVPANYPVEYLRALVTRRGYRPDLAVGAFEGGRLVGFVFNCLHDGAAYNSGTGVVFSHRRQGIARDLMQRSIETLPAERYILEVIETNERAAPLYRSLGFRETRRLQCWSYVGATATPSRGAALHEIRAWCDVAPSWQNATHSIERAIEPYEIHGDEHSGLVVFRSNGDVPLFAVDPKYRRQGRGRKLLDAPGIPLRIINIDDGNKGLAAFLESCGAKRTVRQIEMERVL